MIVSRVESLVKIKFKAIYAFSTMNIRCVRTKDCKSYIINERLYLLWLITISK